MDFCAARERIHGLSIDPLFYYAAPFLRLLWVLLLFLLLAQATVVTLVICYVFTYPGKIKKLAKLGDAIAISNLKLSMTHSLTGVGARRCYRIFKMWVRQCSMFKFGVHSVQPFEPWGGTKWFNRSMYPTVPSLKIIYLSLTKRDKGRMDVRNLVSEQLGARACSTVESIIYAGDEG